MEGKSDGRESDGLKGSRWCTHILVGPWTLSDILVLNSQPFQDLLNSCLSSAMTLETASRPKTPNSPAPPSWPYQPKR